MKNIDFEACLITILNLKSSNCIENYKVKLNDFRNNGMKKNLRGHFWELQMNYLIEFDKMKQSFFQAVIMLILLYGCTTWMLTKQPEKKLDNNYTRMLRATPPQSSSCTAIYHPSRKISKLDEPDMQDTAGEVGTSS